MLPKSVTPARIEENLKTIEFDQEDLAALERIHKKKGVTRFVYPQFGVSIADTPQNIGTMADSLCRLTSVSQTNNKWLLLLLLSS